MLFCVLSKVNKDMAEDVTTLEHVTVTVRDYDLWGKLRDYDLRYNAYDLRYKGYDLRNKLRVKSYNSKNHLCMQFLLYKSITKILKTIFIDDVKWMSHCDYQK